MENTRQSAGRRSVLLPWCLFVLALCLLGATLHYGYAYSRAKLAAADAATDEARKANQDVVARLRAVELQKEELVQRTSELDQQKGALSAELAEKESELAKLKSTADDLEMRMQAEIKKGEIRLTRTAGRVQVDLVDKILFDSGEAKLSRRGEEVLARIAAALARVDDKQIQVSGHTDDSPISERLATVFATNWELSVARAVNVVRFLGEKGQVPGHRLMAAGYGQFKPVSANATPEGRARNRRIEILLTPDLLPARHPVPVSVTAPPPAPLRAPTKAAARSKLQKISAAETKSTRR